MIISKKNSADVEHLLITQRSRFVTITTLNSVMLPVALCTIFLSVIQIVFGFFPLTALALIQDGVAAAALVLAGWIIVKNNIRDRRSLSSIAAMLESRAQLPHQFLQAAVTLSLNTEHQSVDLVAETRRRAEEMLPLYQSIKPIRFNIRRLLMMVVSLMIMAGTLFWCKPLCVAYWDLPFESLKPLAVTVTPGSIAVPRNASIVVHCTPASSLYPSCRLSITSDYAPQRTRLLLPDSSGSFSLRLDSLKQTLIYRFTIGGKSCPVETITVVPPPIISALEATVIPPAYTRLPHRALPKGSGSIVAYAGSRVQFNLSSMSGLSKASIIRKDLPAVFLDVEGKKASGEMAVSTAFHYSFALVDTFGQRSDSLGIYAIDIIPDLPPAVRIIKPGENHALSPAQRETLFVESTDDLGLRRCVVRYHASTMPPDSIGEILLFTNGSPEALMRQAVDWNLAPLGLYPQDTVFYWAVAFDTRPPYGQMAVSDTFYFRLAGFAEIAEAAAGEQVAAQKALHEALATQPRLQSLSDKLDRSLERDTAISWEERQQAQATQDLARAQADSLKKAVDSLSSSISRLKEQGLSSPEILKKMEQIQQAVQDLAKQFGDSLFMKMDMQSPDLSLKDLQQSVNKLQAMLPDMSKRLDETLRFLEQLQRDQTLKSLEAQAKQLAMQQQALMQNQSSQEQKIRQQEQIARDAKDLAQAMDSINRSSDQSEKMAAADSLNQQSDAMQEPLKKGAMPSSPQQRAMQRALMQSAQELQSAQSSARAQQERAEQEHLLAMANDALALAQWQKEIEGAARTGTDLTALTREQKQLSEALAQSMERLDSLGLIMPKALQELAQRSASSKAAMQRMLSAMEYGFPFPASAESQAGLLGLSGALMNIAGQMGQQGQGGGSGESFAQGMQKLSSQQAAVNAMTAELFKQMLQGKQPGQGSGQGEGGSAAHDAAKAQQSIADKLKELGNQAGGSEGGGGDAKRAQELEAEARAIAKGLSQRDPVTEDRQNKLLTRMLQSALSLHKQDEGSEERKSTTATTVYTPESSSENTKGFSGADAYYLLRRKALQGNFPESYRAAVQRYVDSLGVMLMGE